MLTNIPISSSQPLTRRFARPEPTATSPSPLSLLSIATQRGPASRCRACSPAGWRSHGSAVETRGEIPAQRATTGSSVPSGASRSPGRKGASGAPASAPRPVVELLSSRHRVMKSRCHRAKSAYWNSSAGAGSGGLRPRPRRALRISPSMREKDQPSWITWCSTWISA